MATENERPAAFTVRNVGGEWQVFLVERDKWLTCECEDDARAISNAPVLKYDALAGGRSGRAFADELERTAKALGKYHLGPGSRFFTRRAEEVRREECS